MKILFPDELVFETSLFTIHQDWEVPIPGFFILSPKRIVRTIDEFTEEETEEYIRLIRKLRKGMKELLRIETVYFFQNEDSKFNFHLWIFPRYDWMEHFGKGIGSVKSIINHATETMVNNKNIAVVRDCVIKMNKFFSLP